MKNQYKYILKLIISIFVLGVTFLGSSEIALAAQCGSGSSAITTSIDFGCKGEGNAVLDLTFAITRFLSYGVGLVIAASLIVAGLQYIGSQGDPQNVGKAINRIRNSIIALVVFIFADAIINYVVPGGLLK